MITKIKNYIQNHKIISSVGLVVLLGIGYMVFGGGKTKAETVIVEKGNITEQVIVTGKVKPANEVDLAFDRSGKVSRANVQVGSQVVAGQILVSLDSSETYAEYLRAQANVASEQAKLDELKRGTRPEELAISESEVTNAETALSNAEDKLKTALYEAYSKADDAIRNNVDQLFSNPRTSNPQINVTVNDSQLKNDINLIRFEVEGVLNAWNKNSTDTSRASIVKTTNDLNTIKMFVDKVAGVVNALSSNSSLSVATVDSYKASISSARTNLTAAQNSVSGAEEKLNSSKSALLIAQKNLSLKKVGTSAEEVRAQEARVLQYQASLQAVGAQLSKMTLYSPLTGIVTKQDAKVGQTVSVGSSVVSVISNSDLEIEANVSEISVGKVKVGDKVLVTMDAFPDKTFNGTVTYIEPGETIVDGVVNFKITIAFSEKYPEIKTGLSTNLAIITEEKVSVLRVPAYAVTKKEDKSYVMKKVGKQSLETEVTTSFKGSDGYVEVLSGVTEGDMLVLQSK
ncbi:MAG: efflux RND transporter periplasmic adaptor subunit [Candidatus Zambryskibacteria bacterium]|nr:efflux RND transporter periplasmic adaptor subunit [Candidatus Zambryskibacteria bacterium]